MYEYMSLHDEFIYKASEWLCNVFYRIDALNDFMTIYVPTCINQPKLTISWFFSSWKYDVLTFEVQTWQYLVEDNIMHTFAP